MALFHVRCGANHKHFLHHVCVKRKNLPFVLEEHDRIGPLLPRGKLVRLRVALAFPSRRTGEESALRHHVKRVKSHLVHCRHRHLAAHNRLRERETV